jgi:hypothetical protein
VHEECALHKSVGCDLLFKLWHEGQTRRRREKVRRARQGPRSCLGTRLSAKNTASAIKHTRPFFGALILSQCSGPRLSMTSSPSKKKHVQRASPWGPALQAPANCFTISKAHSHVPPRFNTHPLTARSPAAIFATPLHHCPRLIELFYRASHLERTLTPSLQHPAVTPFLTEIPHISTKLVRFRRLPLRAHLSANH